MNTVMIFSSPGTNVLGELMSYPGVGVIVGVVIVDNFRLKFLFINLSQLKVAVNKFKLGKCCSNSEAF